MAYTEQDIEKMFQWGGLELKETKFGKRWMRERKATNADIRQYHALRRDLSPAGVTLSEWPPHSGRYKLTWWKKVSADDEQRHATASILTDASESSLKIPAPQGLSYYPFQVSSVHYFLNALGVDMAAATPGAEPHPRAFKGMFGLPMLPVEFRRTGFLLADEMGLGKTIQAVALINAVNHLAGGKKLGKILYVCPAYMKDNVVREFHKWLVEKYTIATADSKCFPTTEIVVINFQILKKWEARLAQMWDIMIVDEAHNLRTGTAQMTQAAFGKEADKTGPARSGIPSKLRMAMTGTPMMNRPKDLWQIIRWLDPLSWNNYSRYAWRYCGGCGSTWTDKGVSYADELQKKLKESIMVRRLKKDVLTDLPAKVRTVIRTPNRMGSKFTMETEQLREWGMRMAKAKALMEISKTTDNPGEYESAKQHLMEAVDSGAAATISIRVQTAREKLKDAIEIVRNAVEQEGKVVVAAYHTEIVQAIASEFSNSVLIYGGIDSSKRDALVQKFQTDPTCEVAVLSIPVATGMTLTAASTIFFLEESWLPAEIMQAEDRIHRIGQRDCVTVTHIVMEGSIEEIIAEQNLRKQRMMDAVLDINPEKGREMMDPVIPMPGFSATFSAIAVRSLSHRPVDQVVKAARDHMESGRATEVDSIICRYFVNSKRPWSKFVALVELMLEDAGVIPAIRALAA